MKTRDEVLSQIVRMSKGTPGCLRVLSDLFQGGHTDVIDKLEQEAIYGSQVWILYKDRCGCDYDRLVNLVLSTANLQALAKEEM